MSFGILNGNNKEREQWPLQYYVGEYIIIYNIIERVTATNIINSKTISAYSVYLFSIGICYTYIASQVRSFFFLIHRVRGGKKQRVKTNL